MPCTACAAWCATTARYYQALLLLPDTKRWTLVDDASVSDVGSWAAVRHKCQLGRIQPSMLFFEKI